MKYRSRVDIVSQILNAANGGGVTKSKIAYKGFLNYDQLKEYLMALTENNLLRYDEDTRTFKTTERGLRFLHIYNRIGDMVMKDNNSESMLQERRGL